MKLTAKPLAALIFLSIFGGIALTTALGWWQTTTTKVPKKFEEGEAVGQYNPADIRGSYTFGDISKLFGIPLTDLQIAFRLPKGTDPASFQVKSLETQFSDLPVEISTTSLRMFVAFYNGLPYNPEGDTYLLSDAGEVLKKKAPLSPDRIAYLTSHTFDITNPTHSAGQKTPAPLPAPTTAIATPMPEQNIQPVGTEHVAPDRTITGKTTFQDMLNWGVAQVAIEQVIGSPMPDPSTIIREYYSTKGIEFSSAKSTLQALVDQK